MVLLLALLVAVSYILPNLRVGHVCTCKWSCVCDEYSCCGFKCCVGRSAGLSKAKDIARIDRSAPVFVVERHVIVDFLAMREPAPEDGVGPLVAFRKRDS